jgi:hypothetical protein
MPKEDDNGNGFPTEGETQGAPDLDEPEELRPEPDGPADEGFPTERSM